MAIVGMEGFDYFETSNLPYSEVNEKENYTVIHPESGKTFISESIPRFGTGKFLRMKLDDAFRVNVSTTSITTTIYLGFAVRLKYKIAATSFLYIWNSTYTACIKIFITDVGTIYIKNAAGEILGTSTQALVLDTWYWMDIKVIMGANPTGSVTVKVGEDTWLSVTGDTKFNGLSNITTFGLSAGGTNFDFDDLVWADSGGYPATGNYIGDSRIETLMPTGDANVEWSISSTGSHASHVNVITDDIDDVDDKYVYTNITTDEEFYSFDTISTDSVVKALSVDYRAKRDDVQSRTLRGITSSSSQVGDSQLLYTGFVWYSDIFQFSDGASTIWDQTSIGDASFGVQDVT